MSLEFRFLELPGYDNGPHFRRFARVVEARRRECTILLPAGCQPERAFEVFLTRVLSALEAPRYLPIARFCDGEYAFYAGRETTTCWGERASSIRRPGVEERHVAALARIAQAGFLCPNLNLAYLGTQSAFVEFLGRHGMPLSSYAPFYFVYALLVNPRFLAALRGRRIALVSTFANKNVGRIRAALEALGVAQVTICEIPPSGVAHGEFTVELDGPHDAALVGAGIGAPLVLAELARAGCVAVDAGFVFHLWDGTFDRHERLFLNYDAAAGVSPAAGAAGAELPLPSSPAIC